MVDLRAYTKAVCAFRYAIIDYTGVETPYTK